MKKIFIIVVIALVSGAVNAQTNSFTLSYPIAFPMGDMHDYISQVSYRGFSMEFNLSKNQILTLVSKRAGTLFINAKIQAVHKGHYYDYGCTI
jgi:hypothetical protein